MGGHCLFMINGLGLGNSTRCHAIIEHLVERGLSVHILTSGNGLTYFSGCREVASLTASQALFYSGSHGHISGWKTVGSLGALFQLARAKQKDVDAFLEHQSVDVVITDSEYCTAPARFRGIPVLGLNNSDVVVAEYLRRPATPASIRSQFWLMEFTDYLFHRQRCDWVISPSPIMGRLRHPRIRRVGLIVRRAVRQLASAHYVGFPAPRDLKLVVFMLSGSPFASIVPFGRGDFPFRVEVVGRSGDNVGNVIFRGPLMDNIGSLREADALVINGGFSAVSEAIALNKPTFVIPLPNHAEQYVNAHLLSDLGYGYVVRAGEVADKLRRLHALNRWEDMKLPMPILGVDGARESADIICEVMASRQQHSGRMEARK